MDTFVQLLATKWSDAEKTLPMDMFPLSSSVPTSPTSPSTVTTTTTGVQQPVNLKAYYSQEITDMFVQENLLLLTALHEMDNDENRVIHHLDHFLHFKYAEMSSKGKSKLQEALYQWSSAGSSVNPSRAIRKKAQAVLDTLFPNGKYARFILNTSMRVFHQPFQWPYSIYAWCMEKFWAVVGVPVSVWQWIRKGSNTTTTTTTSEADKQKHAS